MLSPGALHWEIASTVIPWYERDRNGKADEGRTDDEEGRQRGRRGGRGARAGDKLLPSSLAYIVTAARKARSNHSLCPLKLDGLLLCGGIGKDENLGICKRVGQM